MAGRILLHFFKQNPIRANWPLHNLLQFLAGVVPSGTLISRISCWHTLFSFWGDSVLQKDFIGLSSFGICNCVAVLNSLLYVRRWIDSCAVHSSTTWFVMRLNDDFSTAHAGSMIRDRPLAIHWVTPPSCSAQPGILFRILVQNLYGIRFHPQGVCTPHFHARMRSYLVD